MRLIRNLSDGWATRMGAVASGVVSWRVALLVLAIVAVGVVLRLLTEWQRRKMFALLLTNAPVGPVIVQQDGPEGEAMTVTWGNSARSAAQLPGNRP